MIGMTQKSRPLQRTFCEVIGQKLPVEMLATIQSPFCASSPTMTLLWSGISPRGNETMPSFASEVFAAMFTVLDHSFWHGTSAAQSVDSRDLRQTNATQRLMWNLPRRGSSEAAYAARPLGRCARSAPFHTTPTRASEMFRTDNKQPHARA
jgi:hypothetical protein